MSKLRVLAALVVVALGLLAVWVAGTGRRSAPASDGDSPNSAYNFEAHDVLVRQMGPDGSLQYELEARHIAQLPSDGKIQAQDLIMRRDPPGSPPGSDLRWTLSALRAELPEAGGVLTLHGKVHAQGRPQNSRILWTFATEQLAFNPQTQDLSSDQPVAATWGGNTIQGSNLRANIKSGDVALNSQVHGTLAP
jgi:LPS export ABC transporter protein LptC